MVKCVIKRLLPCSFWLSPVPYQHHCPIVEGMLTNDSQGDYVLQIPTEKKDTSYGETLPVHIQ
jgi:hypothetical protein